MSLISVYLNDHAANANSSLWRNRLNQYLFRHSVDFKEPKTLDQLAINLQNDLSNGTDYIIAIGGDGTINTLIQKIIYSKITFLIIPAGTANDFASEMGLNSRLENIIKVFNEKSIECVDVLKINDKYMLTNGGIGLSANVAKQINEHRKNSKITKSLLKILGSKTYILYFAKEFLQDIKRYKIHFESKDFPLINKILETPLVMINNQSHIGGNFEVAPKTKNNDGTFNVTIFTHQNKADLLKTSISMLGSNKSANEPHIISFETSHLDMTLLSDDEAVFFGDGEVLETGKSFSISIQPKALSVFTQNNSILPCSSHSLEGINLV
jgi:diacylglycerol kinase (ATP)